MADKIQTYVVREVSIHNNNEIPSGVLHSMNVRSAWWNSKELPSLF